MWVCSCKEKKRRKKKKNYHSKHQSENYKAVEQVPSTFISDIATPEPAQLCFHLPPQTPIHLSSVMEEKPRKKEQDEGIPRCGSQVWRRGECGLGALLGCMQLAFSEG